MVGPAEQQSRGLKIGGLATAGEKSKSIVGKTQQALSMWIIGVPKRGSLHGRLQLVNSIVQLARDKGHIVGNIEVSPRGNAELLKRLLPS